MGSVTVLGHDATGRVVAEYADTGVNGPYAIRYYLTACCAASATGVSGGGTGVACRACYAELPVDFGGTPGPLVTAFGDGLTPEQFRAAKV